MSTVRDMTRKKGEEIFSVSPESAVLDALKIMADRNTGALLVMDGAKVEGIISERDCIRKLDVKGRSAKDSPSTYAR